MRRFWLTVAFATATTLSACESDEAKLKRLQNEASLADLDAFAMHARSSPWPAGLTPEQSKAKLDSIEDADRRALLAHRALDAFMSGR